MLRQRHHWRWKDVRREFVTPHRELAAGHGGQDRAETARGYTDYPVPLPLTRYRYRASNIPRPWVPEHA